MIESIPTTSGIDLEHFVRLLKASSHELRECEQRSSFPNDFFKQLHLSGWLTAFLPNELGEPGLNTRTLAYMMREMGKCAPGVSTSYAGNLLAWVPLLKGLEPRELERRIAAYRSNYFLSSFCFTEPNTGSDVFRAKTTAKKTNDGYLISGQKCFVTNGNFAQQFVVVAKVPDEDPREKKLALFLVDGDSKGLLRGKPYQKMGHRESNTTDIFFESVFVPEKLRLRTEGQSEIMLALQSIQRSRTLLASAAVGLSERVLDLAEEYLANRKLYGKSLLTQPNLRSQLVQCKTDVRAAWLLVLSASESWDQGLTDFSPSSMAKLFAGQTAVKSASAALEMFGGWGCTEDYPIERFYRDAKFYEILEGPSFVQHAIIGKELIKETPTETSNITIVHGKSEASG